MNKDAMYIDSDQAVFSTEELEQLESLIQHSGDDLNIDLFTGLYYPKVK